jgi:hypothetical protein
MPTRVVVRQITHLDRYQVVRLMQQLLEEEPQISLEGKGRGSRYVYRR